jgi:hypothetical protein
MTADEKSSFLNAIQNRKGLTGAGVTLVEGLSAETLRTSSASSRIHIILHRLDQASRHWAEATLKKELVLQLPKVGMQVADPTYVCLIGLHAAFVGVVAGRAAAPGATVSSALLQAASALKDVSQELKPEGLSLQEAMQRENLVFTSVSNVLKTRHDTAKNSISNVR